MRIEELNWMDVEQYLTQDDRLILVLGACEQHGYLSLLTDVKIPLCPGGCCSQQTGVLVAPALNFGASPYFLTYPGTLSLRVSTLLDLVEDLIQSAFGQGFRRYLVLNGHGGKRSSPRPAIRAGQTVCRISKLPGMPGGCRTVYKQLPNSTS